MSTPRRPGESWDDYRSRRKAENTTDRAYLRGRVAWVSRAIVNGKDGKKVAVAMTYRRPKEKAWVSSGANNSSPRSSPASA